MFERALAGEAGRVAGDDSSPEAPLAKAAPPVEAPPPPLAQPVLPRSAFVPPPLPAAPVAAPLAADSGGDNSNSVSDAATSNRPVLVTSTGAPDTPAEIDPASQGSEWWLQVPSWLTSMVVHLTLVLLLAMITALPKLDELPEARVFSTEKSDDDGLDGMGDGDSANNIEEAMTQSANELDKTEAALVPNPVSELPPEAGIADAIGPIDGLALLPRPADVAPGLNGGGNDPDSVMGAGAGGGHGNSLELRLSGQSRAELVRSGGGSKESEAAVERALRWLAEHQNKDGSWGFQHQRSPKCKGACANPGYTAGGYAATAIALMPFLGTGQTHEQGEYKKTIDSGLSYLVRSIDRDGSLYEPGGTMYGQGLCSIVLCEAYGMTHDVTLKNAAQGSVNYIMSAQDPAGGGWRYMWRQPGDTSVVGWQLMALKSAKMAYLYVDPMTLKKANYFLDHVQNERGATYGYTDSSPRPATSAIGLLSRMYLGWKHDTPALQHGVQILGQLGPSTDKTGLRNDMYFNYYATQVMHHYGGYPWQRWNLVMRDYLIKTQSLHGHEYGSWFFDGSDHGGAAGGRLYYTAMAAMTLEVYYRYMPLYREDSVRPGGQ